MIPYIDEVINPPTYMGELVSKILKEMELKKEWLIKSKLIEKGFSKYAETLLTSRFPKVCCHKSNGWSLYYADNDSENGKFIVAITDFRFDNTCEVGTIKVYFNWVDQLPIPIINQQK